ncbi:MAG: hypothetical protein WA622_05575 [Mycobacterium sp.]
MSDGNDFNERNIAEFRANPVASAASSRVRRWFSCTPSARKAGSRGPTS